ncbi:Olfactory receptor 4, partial [Operophtera brumata]
MNPSTLNIYAIRVATHGDSQRAANVSLLVDTMAGRDQPVIVRKTVPVVPDSHAAHAFSGGALSLYYSRGKTTIGDRCTQEGLPYYKDAPVVSTNRVYFLVLQFLWCLTHMLRMLLVVEPCLYTIAETIIGDRCTQEGLPYYKDAPVVSTNRVHCLVLQFLWCLIHMLRMLVVVEPCHYTIAEIGDRCTQEGLPYYKDAPVVYTNRVYFLVLQFLWCRTHMLRMLVVVEPCHYTIAEIGDRCTQEGLPYYKDAPVVSTNRVYFLVLQFLWCLTHMLRMLLVVEPCLYTIA